MEHKKRRKIVAVVVVGMGMFALGLCVTYSREARNFFASGSAIAPKSFENTFAPRPVNGIISEVDIASSSFSNETGTVISASAPCPKAGRVSEGEDKKDAAVAHAKGASPIAEPISTAGTEAISTAASTTSKISSVAAIQNASTDCVFPVSAPAGFSRRIILNEIAWMGSPSSTEETREQAANREWIELKNISGAAIPLVGWQIIDSSGKIKVSFGAGDALPPNGLYVLSRGGSAVHGMSTDKAYAGILPNGGDEIAILDAGCGVSDFLDASSKWPAGSNATKQTLERRQDLGWQTSLTPGGTPHAENSTGVPAAPGASSSTEKYAVSVTIVGNSGGKVTMQPGNVMCDGSCVNEYAKGQAVTLVASAGNDIDFVGWSGGCSGSSTCSFVVGGPVLVAADFHRDVDESLLIESDGTNNAGDGPDDSLLSATSTITVADASTSPATSTADISGASTTLAFSSSSAPSHLVIAAIQIAGVAASDDFVKIYNPAAIVVDLGGWKLRKKSSTGTDASLREFPKASMIAPGGYFTWASSANGFAQSIDADASSTGTLAANNSVALFDVTGAQVDAVAWGTGTGQYVEGTAYPDNPSANQVLTRKLSDGIVIDTDNNQTDFFL